MKNPIMKKIIFSLFSTIFFFGCVTVKKVDKKDSKNNQFSQELQNWFYIKHPQRIDTTTRVKSDTSYYYSDGDYSGGELGTGLVIDLADSSKNFFSIDSATEHRGLTPTISNGEWFSVFNGTNCDSIIERITDTIFITTINRSEINALNVSLSASRDSVSKYILLYSGEQNVSLKRLIAIICMGVALGLSGYFLVKKAIL